MDILEARKLREKWNGEPCDHPDGERERAMGAQTGDVICNTCGEAFTRSEWKERKETKDTQNS